MARKCKRQQEQQRPNPYAHLSDAEFDAVRRALLDAYVERLEYFDALPDFLHFDFKKILEQGPERWGVTRGEWDEYVADRWLHIVEAQRLHDARMERSHRLSEGARAAVSACVDMESANAVRGSYGLIAGDFSPWKNEDETMVAFVERSERFSDSVAEWHGAMDGFKAVVDRECKQMEDEIMAGRCPW